MQKQKSDPNSYDYLFKIIVVGDAEVGKSAFLARYADDQFTTSYISTIGVDFKIKNIEVDGKRVKLQIWDTAGQERFKNITRSYYRGTMCVIIMYDITRKETFDNIEHLLEDVGKYANPSCNKIILGNKKDLESKREVNYQMAKNKVFDPSEDITLLEVSAKDGSGVEEAFITLAREVKSRHSEGIGVSDHVATQKLEMKEQEQEERAIGAFDDDSSAVDYKQLEEEAMAKKIYEGRTLYKKLMTMKRADLKKYLDSKKKLVDRLSNIGTLPMDKEDDLRALAIMVNSLDIVE